MSLLFVWDTEIVFCSNEQIITFIRQPSPMELIETKSTGVEKILEQDNEDVDAPATKIPKFDDNSCGKEVVDIMNVNDFPSAGAKSSKNRRSIECCSITPMGSWLAICDSDKNVFLLQRRNFGWKLQGSFEVRYRIMKLQIHIEDKHLILTDKCGDVYVSSFADMNRVTKFKRILGHCGLIQDSLISTLMSEPCIFTADRDHKIRCSRFPQGHIIDYFLLGHIAPVISMVFEDSETSLFSISDDGVLRHWNIRQGECVHEWKIFEVPDMKKYFPSDSTYIVKEIKMMSACNAYFCAVIISGASGIPIFKIINAEIAFFGHIPIGIVSWDKNMLYHCTFDPGKSVSISRYIMKPEGVGLDKDFLKSEKVSRMETTSD